MAIGWTTAGCRMTGELGDQRYRDLYGGYLALVEKTIAGHAENRLPELTKEYFAKTGEHPLLITVSRKDESGKWQVLLHSTDPSSAANLPAIHWAYSDTVHVHKGDNYVLLETNKTDKGDYKDGLCIRMAVRKSPR